MAVSGLPEACDEHAKCIGNLALGMMELAPTVIVDGEPVVSLVIIMTKYFIEFP